MASSQIKFHKLIVKAAKLFSKYAVKATNLVYKFIKIIELLSPRMLNHDRIIFYITGKISDHYVGNGEQIGIGSYGVVSKHHNHGRTVAIKRYIDDKIDENDDEWEVSPHPFTVLELNALAMLKGPGIICPYAVYLADPMGVRTVFPYHPMTLMTWMCKNKPFCEDAPRHHAKQVMIKITEAVHHIHKRGFIHGDLKPENILICYDGPEINIRIIDMGISYCNNDNESNAMCGQIISDIYRPPELVFGQIYYNSAVDIWSLGCIFAEMFMAAGRRLFSMSRKIEIQHLEFLGPAARRKLSSMNLPNFPDGRQKVKFIPFSKRVIYATSDDLDFIEWIMGRRPTAQQILAHDYFREFDLKDEDCLCSDPQKALKIQILQGMIDRCYPRLFATIDDITLPLDSLIDMWSKTENNFHWRQIFWATNLLHRAIKYFPDASTTEIDAELLAHACLNLAENVTISWKHSGSRFDGNEKMYNIHKFNSVRKFILSVIECKITTPEVGTICEVIFDILEFSLSGIKLQMASSCYNKCMLACLARPKMAAKSYVASWHPRDLALSIITLVVSKCPTMYNRVAQVLYRDLGIVLDNYKVGAAEFKEALARLKNNEGLQSHILLQRFL